SLVLPNMARSPSDAEDVLGRLRALVDRFIGSEVVPLPAIPFDPSVSVAAAAGIPLVLHTPDSPSSRAMSRLVRMIDAIPPEGDGDPDPEAALRLRPRAVEGGR